MRKLLILLLMLCSKIIYGQNSQFANFKPKTKTKFISETLVGFKESSDCGKVQIFYVEFENKLQNQLVIVYERNSKPKLWFNEDVNYRFAIQQLKLHNFIIIKSL